MEFDRLSLYRGSDHIESDVTRLLRAILDASDHPLKVIEIGASYGRQYPLLVGARFDSIVAIDPMYDWVPDVGPDESFDPDKVDKDKLIEWSRNATGLTIDLIVGKSADVARDPKNNDRLSNSDVLVIDGCHHPIEAVVADHHDYARFMNDDYLVLFDDLGHGDPESAMNIVEGDLRASGHTVERHVDHGVGLLHVVRPPPSLQ